MATTPSYLYKATVTKVIDGDTVDLLVDLGLHIRTGIRTRLLGINAPELSTEEGRLARDALRRVLPVGLALIVRTYKDPGDKYGRWLAQLATADIPDVCAWLIANGYAQEALK
jgi:micrococcal nuclease